MPEHPATDNRGQIHRRRETATVLLVGQEVDGQWSATPGQHAHQALLTQRTNQTIERHRGDMADDCAQLPTEAPMGGPEPITGHVRTPVAIAQDDVGEHRDYRFPRGALEAPNGEPTQPDTRLMRMACQTPSPRQVALCLS